MDIFVKKSNLFLKYPISSLIILLIIITGVYYKFFIFGKIPFPGDLLVASYSPWFDYYKIPVQNPLISDVFSQFFLWKYLAIESFKNLEWPLWNPYSFTGTPLLATYHSASLYPLNVILLFPKYFGWGLFIFSQTVIAAFNMYLFLSLRTNSNLARLTGSVIFAFGGLMTTWVELGTAVHTMAWLPLILFGIEKFLKTLKTRYLFLEIISFTFLILAGNAQITTFSFTIIIFYSFILNLGKNFKTNFLPLFFTIITTLFLCAIQIFPTLDLLNKSIRSAESYTDEANFGLLPIEEGLKLFIADFFGNTTTRNYWGFLNYSETSSFVGTLTLPLIFFSCFYLRRSIFVFFFLILLLVSLMLTFDNPLSSAIYQLRIPFLTLSFASRMLFITTFAISVLSALSINQITNKKGEDGRFFKTVIWSWASIVGVFLAVIMLHLTIPEKINILVALRNSILPLLLLTIFLMIFYLIKNSHLKFIRIHQKVFIFSILFIFIVFDLGRYFIKFNPFVSQNLIFPDTTALKFLQKQEGLFRVGREHAEVLPPNTWTAYKLQSYEGYDPIYLNKYGKFMHFLNGGDIRTGNSTRYAEVTSNHSSPYLETLNTKFFIVLKDDHMYIPGKNYKVVFEDKSTAILENPNALERVYFAASVLTLPESKIEDTIMDDLNFNPRKEVALSKDLNIKSVTGKGIAKISYYSPNLIKINTETVYEEVLVLADQYEDGWIAAINGKETKISPANYILRAIKVPPGKNEISFYYLPNAFTLGQKISVISVFFLLVLSAIHIKRKEF